jgi:heptosyltransferase-1
MRVLPSLVRLQPRRVCWIKPSSLGDVVHATPAFAALRALWPDAHMAWLINRGLSGLVEGLPGLDEVIAFDRAQAGLSSRGLLTLSRFRADLRRRRFDVVIDAQGLFRSGLMCWATAAPIRVGLADAREGATRFYTHRVAPPADATHAVDRLRHLARAFGADVDAPRFLVALSDVDRDWARGCLSEIVRPRVVLNVGARWLTKRWSPEQFAIVAGRIARAFGAGLVAVGSPEDRPLVDALKTALGSTPVLDLCGRTSLPGLAAVAAECDVFLSNDTGPLHLAAAAGSRVVGVYTCTNPEKTGPYGPDAVAVRSHVWCAGSLLKRCDRLECMSELSPSRVFDAVAAQLARAGYAACPVG